MWPTLPLPQSTTSFPSLKKKNAKLKVLKRIILINITDVVCLAGDKTIETATRMINESDRHYFIAEIGCILFIITAGVIAFIVWLVSGRVGIEYSVISMPTTGPKDKR